MFNWLERETRLRLVPQIVQAEANLRDVSLTLMSVGTDEDRKFVDDVANAVQYLLHRMLIPDREHPAPPRGIPQCPE